MPRDEGRWIVVPVECPHCFKQWVAIYPVGCMKLQCSRCLEWQVVPPHIVVIEECIDEQEGLYWVVLSDGERVKVQRLEDGDTYCIVDEEGESEGKEPWQG
jgi:hypothetical protein